MKNFILTVVVLFALIGTTNTAGAPTTITLLDKGKTTYCIELPSKPSASEDKAAAILKEYVQKISGVSLIIHRDGSRSVETENKIHVGKTAEALRRFGESPDTLKMDGYRYVITEKDMFLFGGTRNGVVYAVTAFLEDRLGVRKFSADAEYIPTEKTITVPLMDTISIPAVDIRIVNGPMAADSSVKDWRRLTTIADDWRDGNWTGYYVHTFNRLVPWKKYFSSHPEYFGIINGQRKEYAQLCLTNPDVLKVVIDTLRQEMTLHPNVKYWSVSQNDDFEYCRCPRCAAVDKEEGSPSGLILRFVNQVAAAFPDKTITTLAYSYTRKAPKVTRPAPNVMITLCSIEMDRREAIEKEPGSAGFVQDLKEWHAICDNLMIWDYEVQFTNYISPFPLFHTLKPNLELFNRYGAKAHFQQCNIDRGVEFAELKMYVMSKLLWNTNVDVDALVDDFMRHYYGPAGLFVKNYFVRMHDEEITSKQSLDIYGTPTAFSNTLFTAQRITESKSYFDRAEMMVAKNPILLERVKVARLPLLFTEMEIAKTDLFGPRGWFRRENGTFSINKEKSALLDTFVNVCKRNNITHMNENGLTVATYLESTLRFIDVSVEGNLAFEKPVTCTPDPDKRYYEKGAATLTNGVRGAENYRMNWLGWEGMDVVCTVDLGTILKPDTASISSMHYPKSWIIHPRNITCSVSEDGIAFSKIATLSPDNDLNKEPMIKSFNFVMSGHPARFIRFEIEGSKILPEWHTYAGNKSWVFVDEIVVR